MNEELDLLNRTSIERKISKANFTTLTLSSLQQCAHATSCIYHLYSLIKRSSKACAAKSVKNTESAKAVAAVPAMI